MRVPALDYVAVEAFFTVVMFHSQLAIQSQPRLHFLLFPGISPRSTLLASAIELTMLRPQKCYWPPKTLLDRKHQANKQPHDIKTLRSRG